MRAAHRSARRSPPRVPSLVLVALRTPWRARRGGRILPGMSRRPNAGWARRSSLVILTVTVGALLMSMGPGRAGARRRQQPIIVVIESDFARTDASLLRTALADSLGIPVVRLTDPAASDARGTLSLAITRDGRHAHVHYQRTRGTRRAVLVEGRGGARCRRGGALVGRAGVSGRANARALARRDRAGQ